MKKIKLTFDELELRKITFSVSVGDYMNLLQDAARLNISIADILRLRLGLPTAKQLKKKRLERNNLFFN